MLYRKTAPTPPRLLLRIVATVGAGALLGVAACSSSTSSGSVPSAPTDAADEADFVDSAGSIANPFLDATLPCGGGPCGSVAHLPDAGDGGDLPPDASDTGVDAPDDVTHCGGVCGVIVRPDQ
jgi:hypothetical protein